LEGQTERFEVLSVGNLLRKAKKEQTELGKKAEVYMDMGKLVPHEIVDAIVFEEIKKAKKDVIIDGYPRSVAQAEAMLSAGIRPDKVINIYVDDEVVMQRAKDRVVCECCGEPYTTNNFNPPKVEGVCDKCGGKLIRRKDDDEEDVVRKRLEVYNKETHPVLEVFEHENITVFTIDNTQDDSSEKFEKAFEI